MADNRVSSTDTSANSPAVAPPIVRWFRIVAIAEAITWVALLIGMAVKYVPDPNIDSGVRIPGMLHGAVFVLYLVVTVLTALALRWSKGLTVLALLASIPPFGTIIFEVWASRTGRLVRTAVPASPQRVDK